MITLYNTVNSLKKQIDTMAVSNKELTNILNEIHKDILKIDHQLSKIYIFIAKNELNKKYGFNSKETNTPLTFKEKIKGDDVNDQNE